MKKATPSPRYAIVLLFLLCTDLLLINGGFVLCFHLRQRIGAPLHPIVAHLADYLHLVGGTNAFLLFVFTSLGLYRLDPSWSWLRLIAQVARGTTCLALLGLALLFFASGYRHGYPYSRLLFSLYYPFLLFALCGNRLLLRAVLRCLWTHGWLLHRLLVVGQEAPARRLAQQIEEEPLCGYRVVEILVLDEDGSSSLKEEENAREALKDRLRRLQPDGAIFLEDHHSFLRHSVLLLECFSQGREVKIVTASPLLPFLSRRIGDICGQTAVDVTRSPLFALERAIKRVCDLLLSTLSLVVLSPALLLFALLIRLQDNGPSFFLQTRLGKEGRRFRMIKLRTMSVDGELDTRANIAEGPLTRIPHDPRVTPLGRWLRRHKLDELPQLVNVLAGQMSLVGPRPPTEEETNHYMLWQRGRLAVLPGLTGLWQVDKERKWKFDEMVALDLQYILDGSLRLYLSILLRTLPVLLRGS